MRNFLSAIKVFIQVLFQTLTQKLFLILFTFLFFLLVAGVAFYHIVEDMIITEAFYYCVMIMTTVGHTSYIPETDTGKWFTMGYTFLSTGFFLGSVASMANSIVKNAKKINE